VTELIVGRRLLRVGRVDSTMEEVAALARAGEPEGVVVIADEQRAGRGRMGRSWRAPAGTAVLCSILLRPLVLASALPLLSLVAGVAVAEAIEDVTGLSPRLKWPNDVWLGSEGRKVAGLLATARVEQRPSVVLGIGINVTGNTARLPPEATSLEHELGRAVDREAVLHHLLIRLDARYRTFLALSGAVGLDDWQRRAALIGELIDIESGGERRSGRFVGVGDDGALLLETDSGTIESIMAGEVVRGPRLVVQTVP